MKKQKKHKKPQRKVRSRGNAPQNAIKLPVRKRRTGELGIFGRDYPAAAERRKIIAEVRSIPESQRGPDEWWMLGEYLVYDGLMDEEDSLVNEGIQALTEGANHPTPSPACMLDLAWVLMFRGLDGMALQNLQRAVQQAPTSRDAWSLKGLCHIGNSQRDQAIEAYANAVSLPNSTDGDKTLLADLKDGKDLKEIRRNTLLRKIDPEFMGRGRHTVQEQEKIKCHILSPLLNIDPNNTELLYLLAQARYLLGQFDKAKSLLSHLLELAGGHAAAYTMLGLIAKKERNDREQERSLYDRALEVDPDYLLALVNLASSLQDIGEYHAARPLLERALQGDEGDPDYALALDLYGNNVGMIDEDFEEEARLHHRASKLDPTRPLFKANHIIALLSAGKSKDAKSVYQSNKAGLRSVSNFELLSSLIDVYTKDLEHPYTYLQVIETYQSVLSWKAMGPLVRKAWRQRTRVDGDHEEKLDFYLYIGAFAGRAGLHELALEIWQEAAVLPGGEGALINQAVELSALKRHAEALDIANRMPMTSPRSYTVLGNVRLNAGQLFAAVEAYKLALDRDEKFLLPISNAIKCISEMRRPDLLGPFILAINEHWDKDTEARLLKGKSLLLAGRPMAAADAYSEVIVRDGILLTPEQLTEEQGGEEDLSVWGGFGMVHHKAYGTALILASRNEEFEALFNEVMSWPKWIDGDWRVLLAESHRRRGDLESAESELEGMQTQPPQSITISLCHLERGNFAKARKFAEKALNDPRSEDQFNHIEGRPDAVGLAVIAMALIEDGNNGEAIEHAKSAVSRDVGCAIARIAYAKGLVADGDTENAIRTLLEGLERAPYHPAMVRMAVETLVSTDRNPEAGKILGKYRAGLAEFGVTDLGYRLGELVVAAKLAATAPPENERKAAESDWPWIMILDDPIRRWMIGAHRSAGNLDVLRIALVMFAGKVSEKLIVDRILVPFRESLSHPEGLTDPKYRDFSSFIQGGRAPSIGGFVLFLRAANKPAKSSDSELISEFRSFLGRLAWPDARRLTDKVFVQALDLLAGTRNASAHIDEPTQSEVLIATSIVVTDSKPGPLFAALGVSL